MDAKDRKLLNRLQENFPLVKEPYKNLGEEVRLAEKEVRERIKRFYQQGLIRRFGVLINHKTLKYFSTLLGVKVAETELPNLVALVTSRPEVTHCYQRRGEYNLWFTFLTPKQAIFEKFYSQLKKKYGAENILNLPTIRSYKLRTTFEI
ncbi:Lrp/AsnC family transcriptional regulator [Candidatus Saganbacteria bacterium]|nr:Lrp/AsnC family transcriptional regulator [Candidatus Saganbacteria bacterium]